MTSEQTTHAAAGAGLLASPVRRAIVDALVAKAMLACRRKQVLRLVIGGGVAANSLLRSELMRVGPQNDVEVYLPPKRLCTDNAVMIGAAALGSAWRKVTVREDSPLRLAITMYSDSRTSIMVPRTSR